jgi:hypothetical protein
VKRSRSWILRMTSSGSVRKSQSISSKRLWATRSREARNDQLYDELVGRAAAIERNLNIPDGAFANRPTAWLRIRFLGMTWNIDHRRALCTIYAASIALWLFGFVAYVLEYSRRVYAWSELPSVSVKNLSVWMDFIALVIAVIVTLLGSYFIRR